MQGSFTDSTKITISHTSLVYFDLVYSSLGLLEADAAMVLDKSGKFTLFLKPEDAHSKVWDGARTGLEDAKRLFGADEARPISEFSAFIKTLDGKVYSDLDIEKGIEEQSHLKLASNSHAASSPDKDQSISSFIMNSFRSKKSDIPARVEKSPLIPLMHPMRLIKSESEIECMKKACEITSEAFKDVTFRLFNPLDDKIR
jgi:Xaa-Pro aminopeptidase